jgi:hypothetical protein
MAARSCAWRAGAVAAQQETLPTPTMLDVIRLLGFVENSRIRR